MGSLACGHMHAPHCGSSATRWCAELGGCSAISVYGCVLVMCRSGRPLLLVDKQWSVRALPCAVPLAGTIWQRRKAASIHLRAQCATPRRVTIDASTRLQSCSFHQEHPSGMWPGNGGATWTHASRLVGSLRSHATSFHLGSFASHGRAMLSSCRRRRHRRLLTKTSFRIGR